MIIRAEHTEGFLRVSNSSVWDTRLSCEACGLLVRMLSLPDDWEFSVSGLVSKYGMPTKAVRRLVKELRDAGYIEVRQKRNERGFFACVEWLVYEVPIRVTLSGDADNGVPDSGVPVHGVPDIGKPEKGTLLTTKLLTTKELTTKGTNYIPGRGEFLNVYVSEIEFGKLTERFGEAERDARIEDLSRYLANHPKKKYASHYATILAWARKDQKDSKVSSIPTTAGDIDWDRVAREAAEMFNGGQNT